MFSPFLVIVWLCSPVPCCHSHLCLLVLSLCIFVGLVRCSFSVPCQFVWFVLHMFNILIHFFGPQLALNIWWKIFNHPRYSVTSQSNIGKRLLLLGTHIFNHFHNTVFDKLTIKKRFAKFSNERHHLVVTAFSFVRKCWRATSDTFYSY